MKKCVIFAKYPVPTKVPKLFSVLQTDFLMKISKSSRKYLVNPLKLGRYISSIHIANISYLIGVRVAVSPTYPP